MKYLTHAGYEIIIITNQYIIGEGIISFEQYQAFSDRLEHMLLEHDIHVLDTFYCPHARCEPCDCRKPNTGLIRSALIKYPSIDLSASFMCGDSICDMKCAEHMGLTFYGIHIGKQRIENLSDIRRFIQ